MFLEQNCQILHTYCFPSQPWKTSFLGFVLVGSTATWSWIPATVRAIFIPGIEIWVFFMSARVGLISLKTKMCFKSLLKIVLIKIKSNKNNLYSITNVSNKMSTRENKLNGIFPLDCTPDCGKEFTYLKVSYFFNLMRERKYIYVKLKTQMFSKSYDNSSV